MLLLLFAAPYDAPQLEANAANATCVVLTWKEPEDPNGIILQYNVSHSTKTYSVIPQGNRRVLVQSPTE